MARARIDITRLWLEREEEEEEDSDSFELDDLEFRGSTRSEQDLGNHVALKPVMAEANRAMLEEVRQSRVIKVVRPEEDADEVDSPVYTSSSAYRVSSYFTSPSRAMVPYDNFSWPYAKLFWRLELAKLPSMTLETFSSCPPGKIPCVVWTRDMPRGRRAPMTFDDFAMMEAVPDSIVCFYHVTLPPFMNAIHAAPREGLRGANREIFIDNIENRLRGASIAYWESRARCHTHAHSFCRT